MELTRKDLEYYRNEKEKTVSDLSDKLLETETEIDLQVQEFKKNLEDEKLEPVKKAFESAKLEVKVVDGLIEKFYGNVDTIEAEEDEAEELEEVKEDL